MDGFRLVAMETIWDECGADPNVEPQDRCRVWQETKSFAADSRITTAPLLADGVLYIGTQDGIVHAVDATDGRELWSFDADARVEGIAVIPNAIFVTTADGVLIAIAGQSGTEG